MAMRLSGLMSGMDTETIIQDLVAVRQSKVDEVKKEQIKLEWKQEAWKELNTKIKKLYNGTLSNLRFQSSFVKKVTKVSDSSVAEVIADTNAMDSVQSLKVSQMAHTGYLTGAVVSKSDGSKCTSGTKLVDMGIEAGSQIEINTNGKTVSFTVDENTTLGNFTSKLNSAGLKANFDSKTQRLFIGASDSGELADFTITASNAAGTQALDKMGILVYGSNEIAEYKKVTGLLEEDGSKGEAYQKALDDAVAAQLKTYVSKAAELEKTIAAKDEAMAAVKDSFVEKYGDEALWESLVANTDGARDKMATRIEELEGKEELTDDEKTELADIKEKMSFVEDYEALQAEKTTAETELTNVQQYFTGDDKVASEALIEKVTQELDAKIANAQNAVANVGNGTNGATKVDGCDAQIYLNGALFESATNTFEINGLTITCNAETGDREVTLTTQNDTSGIYDMIKGFIKEYSELMAEMDKLYNAEEAKGYEPLTDEEKYEMSESEVEKWEEKVKEALLRKDSTLYSVSSALRGIMNSGFTVNGETMYLSHFGIEPLGYFEAADNERNVLHINGDEEDEYVSSKTNKLQAMISTDPDAVTSFFSQLAKSLYEKTSDMMKSVQGYSSAFTVYEDKKMKSDYDDYTKKIKELEDKLADYEDKWYKKFAAMETAMAKMQSNASAVTSLIGGNM